MMRTALWVNGRELVRRKRGVLLAVGAMAVAIGVCTATDYVAYSRQLAVAIELDRMGPGLVVMAPQYGTQDLLRFDLGSTPLPGDLAVRVRNAAPKALRGVEKRLLLQLPVAGKTTSIAGIDPASTAANAEVLGRLKGREIVLGSALAERLDAHEDDVIEIHGKSFRVAGTRPVAGTVNDECLFISLEELCDLVGQPGAANALFLYPEPGVRRGDLQQMISARLPGFAILAIADDDDARYNIEANLGGHRAAVFLVMGSLAMLFVLVWSSLDTEDRRPELATIVALGGSANTILLIIGTRAVFLGLVSALFGLLLGGTAGIVIDALESAGTFWSLERVLVWPAIVIAIFLAGTVPAAVKAAYRDQVAELVNR